MITRDKVEVGLLLVFMVIFYAVVICVSTIAALGFWALMS